LKTNGGRAHIEHAIVDLYWKACDGGLRNLVGEGKSAKVLAYLEAVRSGTYA
jgi:hypothetical protein